MAVYKQNNFNSGTPAADATAASTATSGDQFTSRVKNGAATCAYTTTVGEVIRTTSVRMAAATAGTDNTYYYWDHAGTPTAGLRASFRFTGAPTVNTPVIALRRTASGASAAVVLRTDGKLSVFGNVVEYYQPPNAISANAEYTIDLAVTPGTSTTNGKLLFAVYDSAGGYALGTSAAWEKTDANAGGATSTNIVRGLVGILDTGGIITLSVDDVIMLDTYELAGPVGLTATPVTYGRHIIIGA